MTAPTPPPRDAHHIDNESYGRSLKQCAINLVDRLASLARPRARFTADANGEIWHFMGDYDERAQLLFASDHGHGIIELEACDNGWVRAELLIDGDLKLRAWVEQAYEEKELWPDGADGNGEAPGRISKRDTWLQLDRARFGLPDDGYWRIDIAPLA